MLKKLSGVFIFCLVPFFIAASFAATKTVTYDVSGLDWSYGDTSSVEHWMPFYLPVVQTGFRWKAGIRISNMAIAVKAPIKLELSYDDALTGAGSNLKIKVKATPQASDQRTFDSNFGISLPNKMQLGFINVAGIPDLLPWYTISGDLWDLIALVPTVGEAISTAATNIGVSMNSQEALPSLGASKEYHDTRTLFSLDLTKLLEGNKKNVLIGKIWGWLGPKKDAIVAAIQVAKMCNENTATNFAKDLIGKGIEILAGIAQISLKGDPYFSIKSEKIALIVDWNIGGRTSGSNAINLIPGTEEGEFTINIPAFVQSGEKITLVPSSVTYEFKLDQKLQFQIAVPVVGDINLGDATKKTVVYKYVNKKLTASDFKLEIPLSASTLPIVEFLVTPGCSSAVVLWASPNIDLRGTVDVFQNSAKVKSVSESGFGKSHALMIDGLLPNTPYTFHLSCVDRSNIPYTVNDLTATTKNANACAAWSQNPSVGTVSLTGDSATAGFSSITFNWTTSRLASTELYFSNSPDFGSSYLSAVKKADGSFAVGWADYSSLDRKLETNHTITIPNLQTGSTYHCRLVSWTYKNDKVADGFDVQVDKTVVVTTLSAPSTKVLVRLNNNPVDNLTVAVFKTATPNNKTLYVTGADGYTPVILLEQGASYQAAMMGQACYDDITSSTLSVAGNAQGALANINLDIARKASPGSYVYDSLNNPIVGASVRMPLTDSSVSVVTDNNGFYTIDRPFIRGEKDVVIAKAGYITQTIKGTFDNCGLFSAAPVVLSSGAITLNIHVTASGNPLIGATLRAISVSWEMGTATTDAQGNAAITLNRATIPTVTPLDIEVTPPQGSKAIAKTFSGNSYNLGQPTTIDLNCEVDVSGPVITSFTRTQYGQNGIQVSFTTNEPVVYALEIKKPDNQILSANYPASYTPEQMATSVSGITFTVVGDSGIYKVRLKVKDAQGNETDSGYLDFAIFNDSSWGFKIKSMAVNSAVLIWNKFPRLAEFSKYQILKDGNIIGTLTDIDTTEYSVTGLNANTSYTYALRCINKGNVAIGSGASFTFVTGSLRPEIKQFLVTPKSAALSEDLLVSAAITDTDSNIKNIRLLESEGTKPKVLLDEAHDEASINFSKTIKFDQPGIKKIVLEAKDEGKVPTVKIETVVILDTAKPKILLERPKAGVFLNLGFSPAISVNNVNSLRGDIYGHIDWGDGVREDFDLGVGAKKAGATAKADKSAKRSRARSLKDLKHVYTKSGDYTITATASVEDSATMLTSDPASITVLVSAQPPVLELLAEAIPSNPNTRKIIYKVIPGSLPVESWEISFGDEGRENRVERQDEVFRGALEQKEVAVATQTKTRASDSVLSSGPLRGQGTANSFVAHLFQARGNYDLKLTVKEVGGKEYVKDFSIIILANWKSSLGSGSLRDQAAVSGLQRQMRVELKETAGERVTTVAGAVPAPINVSHVAKRAANQQITTTAATSSPAVTTLEKKPVDLEVVDLRAPREIIVGQSCDFEVIIKNNSENEVREVVVNFETEEGFKDRKVITLRSGAQERMKFSWAPRKEGRQRVNVLLECRDDENPRNNSQFQMVEVKLAREVRGVNLEALATTPEVIREKERSQSSKKIIAETKTGVVLEER